MANAEHLAILRGGVEAWNEWRKNNSDPKLGLIEVDLRGADLSEAYLCRANLREADLRGADLRWADLCGVNLIDADLRKAHLRPADLIGADLRGANLHGADLIEADLRGANLSHADLRRAKLSEANLIKVDLIEADLVWADLREADLRGADLRWADLRWADLHGANLIKADLSGADLRWAKLIKADLRWADLRVANLIKADFSEADLREADLRYGQLPVCSLTKANLTGAKLYATWRHDWIIKDVECSYVFWDVDGEIRSPEDRDLAPGEFEQLYRTLPTIEYIFQNGMTTLDPLIMDRVVRAIRERNPEYDIKIDSISARGLAPSIKFTVQRGEHMKPALAEVTKRYEAKLQELHGRLDELRRINQHLIDRPSEVHIRYVHGAYIAVYGSTINIDQHVECITKLRDAVAALPEDSPTFAQVAKKTALDLIGSALKNVAKGQVKKAAEQIIELGKVLGPVIVNTAAYAFFKSMIPGG
jgi:uncharacterized protein YjbI with pentapeptide repeats